MDLSIALVISILSITFTIINFAIARKDKANKDGNKQGVIEYRLEDLSKKVDKILDKLDKYDKEVDEKIGVAMQHHIAEMHNK